MNARYTSLGSVIGTGLYHGTLNGVATSFVCDDDLNNIGNPGPAVGPSTWNVNIYNLSNVAIYSNGLYAVPSGDRPKGTSLFTATGDSPNLSPTPSIKQDYNMVAYLADLLLTGTVNSTKSETINAIQWAIWDIMDSPKANGILDPGGTGCTLSSTSPNCGSYWVEYAWRNELNYSNPYIVFYTPDGTIISGDDKGRYAQEVIGLVTPEPLSMALMGTFLTLAGLGLGKKKLLSLG